jgi:hypothetical protein
MESTTSDKIKTLCYDLIDQIAQEGGKVTDKIVLLLVS